MRRKPLGCLSPLGITGGVIMLLVVFGISAANGFVLFNPGPLNAQPGAPLGGITAHSDLSGECASCHSSPFDGDTMSDRCIACHADINTQTNNLQSMHGVVQQTGTHFDCLTCHTDHTGPTGSLTHFDKVARVHEITGFSLARHLKNYDGKPMDCKACHPASLSEWDSANCQTCHAEKDPTAMQEHTTAFGSACLGCHTGVDRYSGFDHKAVAFPLDGKHSTLACQECHAGASTTAALKELPKDCLSCHQEDDTHQGKMGIQCETCHSAQAWKPVQFDHTKTSFALTGVHAKTDCASCHPNSQFENTASECIACHATEDEHQGQFGSDCAACHKSDGWKPAAFDHSKSKFQLTGKHAKVECQQCHKDNAFKGTSSECAACHTDPVFHAGSFSGNCSACHNAESWAPAKYSQPHSFPISHEGATKCRDCHTADLKTYTCTVCHEQSRMISKHSEEGISNISDCMRCHKDGRKEEGGD